MIIDSESECDSSEELFITFSDESKQICERYPRKPSPAPASPPAKTPPALPAPAYPSSSSPNKGRHGRTHIPEDGDDIHGTWTLNNCTGETDPNKVHGFDYHRYVEYHRYCHLLKQVRRLKGKMKEAENGDGVELSDSEDAHDFEKLFVEQYGSVDFTDPLMSKRLEVMKQTIEEMALPVDEDKVIIQLLDEDLQDDGMGSFNYADVERHIQSDLLGRFTAKEIQLFECLDSEQAEAEWFLLPRGELKAIREKHFPEYAESLEPPGGDDSAESVPSVYGGVPEGTNSKPKKSVKRPRPRVKMNPSPLTNLHLYDPKFEYCFSQPYRIFDACEELIAEDVIIPKTTAFKILDVLNAFPLGIETTKVFWQEYCLKHGMFPTIPGVPQGKVLECLRGEVFIVPKEGHFPEMAFPGSLENIVDRRVILKRIWHAIMCIVAKSPILRYDELFPRLENEFGLKFDPCSWGFSKGVIFLDWAAKVFNLQNVFGIHRVTSCKKHVLFTEDFFLVKSPLLLEKMALLRGGKTTRKEQVLRTPIPDYFIGHHQRIPCLSDEISNGHVDFFDMITVFSPHQFMLMPRILQPTFWKFHETLQQPEESNIINQSVQPVASELVPGLFVLARLDWEGYGWYRVRIVWWCRFKKEYYVYGIDAGFFRYVSITNIRYIPKGEISKLPAHAIPAGMIVSHPNPIRAKLKKVRWENVCVAVMNKLLEKCYLRVQFVSGKFNPRMGCTLWSVNVNLVSKHPVLFKCYSFAATFIEEFKIALLKQRTEQRAKLKKEREAELKVLESIQEEEIDDETGVLSEETVKPPDPSASAQAAGENTAEDMFPCQLGEGEEMGIPLKKPPIENNVK